jgi:hypothetical protein
MRGVRSTAWRPPPRRASRSRRRWTSWVRVEERSDCLGVGKVMYAYSQLLEHAFEPEPQRTDMVGYLCLG